MLTIAAAKAAGAQARAYKMFDGGGLHLHVAPTGTKSWRLKYRVRGREKLLTFGQFPAMSLAEARACREQAKAALRDGADPARSDEKLETFEQCARAWYRLQRTNWSPAHARDVIASLEREIFPAIGATAIDDVNASALLNVMREIEGRGCIETARRIRQRIAAVFGFAMAQDLATSNPAEQLGFAMGGTALVSPHAALTDLTECRDLLAACEVTPSAQTTRLAGRFLALTAVRLDAVRGMCWREVENLDGPEPLWRVPAARMKLARIKKGETRFDHLVPLAPAAVEVLRAALRFAPVNEGGLVFPGRGGCRPIGEGAIRQLINRAGYRGRHVPHGWRSSFSTILNEELGPESRGDIDLALAHTPKDKVEAAYNRAQLLDRRRDLMERWGAMLG